MNHFAFECPIIGGAALLENCEAVHSKAMQGRHAQIDNKRCGVAHACWMCPARNAFRVSGPWAHYDAKPRWDAPREKPAKLPKDLVDYSLLHTLPNESDYRRVGAPVGAFDEELRALQAKVSASGVTLARPVKHSRGRLDEGETDQAPSPAPRKQTSRSATGVSKPASAADAIAMSDRDDMAQTVNELMAESKRQKSAPERDTDQRAPETRKDDGRASQRKSESAQTQSRPMSLAERARQMKRRAS